MSEWHKIREEQDKEYDEALKKSSKGKGCQSEATVNSGNVTAAATLGVLDQDVLLLLCSLENSCCVSGAMEPQWLGV